jgi:hypothetical protein
MDFGCGARIRYRAKDANLPICDLLRTAVTDHSNFDDHWIAKRVHDLVIEQQVAAQLAAAAINRAVRAFEKLPFPLGFPVPGHDKTTVLALLRELTPVEQVEAWRERAREVIAP